MKVQLPVRWLEKKLMDDELLRIKRLVEGIEEPVEETEFTFGRVVLDTKDIKSFNELDGDSTIVRTYTPESYCIAVPFEEFSKLYTELTAEMITIVERREPKKLKAPKKKNPPSTKDEDDDFLK